MTQLKVAINIVEILVVVIVAMLLGDYLGYKFGRLRLAAILCAASMVVVIAFTIYAAIILF